MENDHYIDSLQVDLRLREALTPLQARDEADDLVDRHVVTAVEAVVEDLGREIDADIPQLEIEVGRVRAEDLRDAVEAALRNALERYRKVPGKNVSPTSQHSSLSPGERLQEYAESGIAPWSGGGAPFHPSRFLAEVLKNDPGTFLESVESFTEKELAGLLFASDPAASPEDGPKVRQFREAILARLSQVYPETAAVLAGRMAAWHRAVAPLKRRPLESEGEAEAPEAASVGEVVDLPEAATEAAAEPIQEPVSESTLEPAREPVPETIPETASQPAPEPTPEPMAGPVSEPASGPVPRTFRYVEVDLTVIPEGYPLESMLPAANPGENDPEYIVSPGTPLRYYRKVAESGQAPAEENRYRYVEIPSTDIPEEVPVVSRLYTAEPDVNDPEYILTPGDPLRYYRKVSASAAARLGPSADGPEISAAWRETLEERQEALTRQRDSSAVRPQEPADRSEVPADRSEAPADRTDMPADQTGATEQRPEAGEGQTPAEGGRYRYVEIRLADIPAGVPVVSMPFKAEPDEKDPVLILSPGQPLRYYRKTAVTIQPDATVQPGVAGLPEASISPAIASEAPGGQAPTAEAGQAEGPYRYVEIRLADIPAGVPVVTVAAATAASAPVENDPEYILSPGPPSRYYRKVAAGDAGDIRDDQEVWEVRDFEAEVPAERIPVSDAGLVLLHPFLGRLMENLGLVKKGAFVSPLARIRAVHLLRDLTGSDEPHYNHNLLLEKILCGLPVGYVLPSEWEPTEQEKEETEALLRAVCEYWRPLARSSTSALCSSFILRAGAIERFEDTWTVRVEGRAIDILLDDLPWELSIVMLPWLEKPLAVEWQQE